VFDLGIGIDAKISPLIQTILNINLIVKKTRTREFLGEMDQVVPWAALLQHIAPY
jgi:IS5 family transposase